MSRDADAAVLSFAAALGSEVALHEQLTLRFWPEPDDLGSVHVELDVGPRTLILDGTCSLAEARQIEALLRLAFRCLRPVTR